MGRELLTRVRLQAQACHLKELRRIVHAAIGDLCGDPECADRLVIAINEAGMNVIQHAYGDGAPGEMELEVYHQDGTLVFRLIDFAPPVDKCRLEPRDCPELRPGGLGLRLIREVMDEVEWVEPADGTGNVLEMKLRLGGRGGDD